MKCISNFLLNVWSHRHVGTNGVIKMSFNTLNHSPVCICNGAINKKIMHYRARSNSSMCVKVSSVLLKTEENGSSPASRKTRSKISLQRGKSLNDSCLCRENVVGVIGGASVFSTLIFLEKLIWWSSRNGGKCFPFIVCSEPTIGDGRTTTVEGLKHKRTFLEESGVGCIVMPCHVSHALHKEVSEGCSVEFLDVGDCVARELKEANLKPLEAGSCVRVGVLAPYTSLMVDFYQEKLQNQGFEAVLPDKPTVDHMITPAIEALSKKDRKGAQTLLRIAVHGLLVKGVNVVILACNEFHDLLPFDDPLLKRCINPMDSLARSTIQWARAAEKAQKPQI